MLEEGQSYSGYEKNSAFLNLGPDADGLPRYADVSGASGLDVLDDGRAIALTDWDHDGRMDFWVTNRTGPRLRLQRNVSETENGFVAIRLLGQSVGARLRLTTGNRTLVRSLRAGEGFLAQSSKWLHFGLLKDDAITKAEVRWPGERRYQLIEGLQANRFHTIRRGEVVAKEWLPPTKPALPEADPIEPASQRARIVMASRLPLPATQYIALDGNARALPVGQRPLLVNLWASWCQPCLVELHNWQEHKEAMDSLGLQVLLLSVDALEDPESDRLAQVKRFLEKEGLSFEAGLVTHSLLEMLEVAGRAQIDKFEPFPVPSSVLVDREGKIAAIYRGPVSALQLMGDLDLLESDASALASAAAHFPGAWIEGPWPATPTVMIDKFMSFGEPAAARAYLDTFASANDERAAEGLAESYYLVANELRLQGNATESIQAYEKAAAQAPNKPVIRRELGTMHFRARQFDKAAPHLDAALSMQPDDTNTRKMLALSFVQTKRYADAVPHLKQLIQVDPRDGTAHLWLGHSLVRVRRAEEALVHFRAALRLQPDSIVVKNELAWLLVTHSSASVRNTKEGLTLIESITGDKNASNPAILDTLAAAQAATGQFPEAVALVKRAIQLAKEAGSASLETALRKRLAIYQQGRPYREIAPAQP